MQLLPLVRTLFVVPLATVSLALAGTPSPALAAHDRAASREAPQAKPTKVHITVKAPKNVLSGSRITVAGRVTTHPGGAGVATKVVIESMRFPGGSTSWQRVGTTQSRPDGTYKLKRRLVSSLYLRARALPSRRNAGATTGRVVSYAREQIKVIAATPRTVEPGAKISVRGTTTPNLAGDFLTLQEYNADRDEWRIVHTARVSKQGRYLLEGVPQVSGAAVQLRIKYGWQLPTQAFVDRYVSAGDFQVYGWHHLDDLDVVASSNDQYGGGGEPGWKIGGVDYPHTVDLLDLSEPHRPSWLEWRLDQRCTEFDGFAGVADTSSVASTLSVGSGTSGIWSGIAMPGASATRVTVGLPGAQTLRLGETSAPASAFALFGAARVKCAFPRSGRPDAMLGSVFRAMP